MPAPTYRDEKRVAPSVFGQQRSDNALSRSPPPRVFPTNLPFSTRMSRWVPAASMIMPETEYMGLWAPDYRGENYVWPNGLPSPQALYGDYSSSDATSYLRFVEIGPERYTYAGTSDGTQAGNLGLVYCEDAVLTLPKMTTLPFLPRTWMQHAAGLLPLDPPENGIVRRYDEYRLHLIVHTYSAGAAVAANSGIWEDVTTADHPHLDHDASQGVVPARAWPSTWGTPPAPAAAYRAKGGTSNVIAYAEYAWLPGSSITPGRADADVVVKSWADYLTWFSANRPGETTPDHEIQGFPEPPDHVWIASAHIATVSVAAGYDQTGTYNSTAMPATVYEGLNVQVSWNTPYTSLVLKDKVAPAAGGGGAVMVKLKCHDPAGAENEFYCDVYGGGSTADPTSAATCPDDPCLSLVRVYSDHGETGTLTSDSHVGSTITATATPVVSPLDDLINAFNDIYGILFLATENISVRYSKKTFTDAVACVPFADPGLTALTIHFTGATTYDIAVLSPEDTLGLTKAQFMDQYCAIDEDGKYVTYMGAFATLSGSGSGSNLPEPSGGEKARVLNYIPPGRLSGYGYLNFTDPDSCWSPYTGSYMLAVKGADGVYEGVFNPNPGTECPNGAYIDSFNLGAAAPGIAAEVEFNLFPQGPLGFTRPGKVWARVQNAAYDYACNGYPAGIDIPTVWWADNLHYGITLGMPLGWTPGNLHVPRTVVDYEPGTGEPIYSERPQVTVLREAFGVLFAAVCRGDADNLLDSIFFLNGYDWCELFRAYQHFDDMYELPSSLVVSAPINYTPGEGFHPPYAYFIYPGRHSLLASKFIEVTGPVTGAILDPSFNNSVSEEFSEPAQWSDWKLSKYERHERYILAMDYTVGETVRSVLKSYNLNIYEEETSYCTVDPATQVGTLAFDKAPSVYSWCLGSPGGKRIRRLFTADGRIYAVAYNYEDATSENIYELVPSADFCGTPPTPVDCNLYARQKCEEEDTPANCLLAYPISFGTIAESDYVPVLQAAGKLYGDPQVHTVPGSTTRQYVLRPSSTELSLMAVGCKKGQCCAPQAAQTLRDLEPVPIDIGPEPADSTGQLWGVRSWKPQGYVNGALLDGTMALASGYRAYYFDDEYKYWPDRQGAWLEMSGPLPAALNQIVVHAEAETNPATCPPFMAARCTISGSSEYSVYAFPPNEFWPATECENWIEANLTGDELLAARKDQAQVGRVPAWPKHIQAKTIVHELRGDINSVCATNSANPYNTGTCGQYPIMLPFESNCINSFERCDRDPNDGGGPCLPLGTGGLSFDACSGSFTFTYDKRLPGGGTSESNTLPLHQVDSRHWELLLPPRVVGVTFQDVDGMPGVEAAAQFLSLDTELGTYSIDVCVDGARKNRSWVNGTVVVPDTDVSPTCVPPDQLLVYTDSPWDGPSMLSFSFSDEQQQGLQVDFISRFQNSAYRAVAQGLSPYEVDVRGGFVGNLAAWLAAQHDIGLYLFIASIEEGGANSVELELYHQCPETPHPPPITPAHPERTGPNDDFADNVGRTGYDDCTLQPVDWYADPVFPWYDAACAGTQYSQVGAVIDYTITEVASPHACLESGSITATLDGDSSAGWSATSDAYAAKADCTTDFTATPIAVALLRHGAAPFNNSKWRLEAAYGGEDVVSEDALLYLSDGFTFSQVISYGGTTDALFTATGRTFGVTVAP